MGDAKTLGSPNFNFTSFPTASDFDFPLISLRQHINHWVVSLVANPFRLKLYLSVP